MDNWIKEFNGAITLCDDKGIIVYMNDKAIETFKNDGGEKLIGTDILDCHPEPSKTILKNLMDERKVNVYTIEKNGVKKLIYQSPTYDNGVYSGFIEFSLEIPFELPNFIRK
ncbi:MAG: PAS domain-containing protein [Ignavibacteriae bacterium]|nr:PAS domain-containing protein [Ignavibacteriota bacterium]